ncbi:MAG TPA: ABC transporter substrate-binding protein [Stellaceae bacterium]|jgi:branched-chain amino acid transport system substrate-binding protein|nr:ABC transporter substrate-binding protein [Stellaceae bacterium]
MSKRFRSVNRRQVLKGAAATGVVAAASTGIFRPAFAVPETVKIGLVGPRTGPLALFYEEMSYCIEHAKKTMHNQIVINGTTHPLEIVTKDSQSNPNRASEVAQELILKDKVHVVTAFATPETVNPVSDQCEINGMPCVTNDDPLESYFFGRKGDPKKGFEWTYNFFFSGAGSLKANMAGWAGVPGNKKVGVLWANDDDGRTFAQVMPPAMREAGFTVVDPGRFDLPSSNYTAQITRFKADGADVCFTVIPGPDFTVFWNQCAQQGYRPKAVQAGKVSEFPQGVYPFGDRANNFFTEVWWSKFHPFKSSLTGQSSMEFNDEYEKNAKQQGSMGLGFRHSLLEVPIAALERTQKLDDPASIRDSIRGNSFNTIVGPIDFKKGPFPNTSETKCVAGQWRKGNKWPLELVIVDNKYEPDVPVGGKPEAIAYS